MYRNAEIDVNSAATILALCLLASVTPSAVLLGPLIVGGLITELGFTPQAAGNMIFAELSGAALSTFLALYWIPRADWRLVLRVALVAMATCNILSAFLVDAWLLGASRFICGIGVGTVMAATLLVCGMTRNQERVLSFWQMGQIIFASIALAAMPSIFSAIGIRGMYLMLALVMAVLMVAVPYMPRGGGPATGVAWRELPSVTRRYAPVGLLGLLFFFVAMGGVWNFAERLGDEAGLDREFIALTLAAVSACGVLGSICSALLGLRWGRTAPFVIGTMTLAASMLLFYDVGCAAQFVLAAFLFKFGWWFISPYILANITTLDASGKLVAATNFVIAFGQALGPLLVGFILAKRAGLDAQPADYAPAIQMGLVCLALCSLLFITVIRANDRQSRGASDSQRAAAGALS